MSSSKTTSSAGIIEWPCSSADRATRFERGGRECNPLQGHMTKREQLDAIAAKLSGCTRCPLACKRTNIVMGQGNLDAEVVFVGEAPGEEEDKTGLAFVGRSGQLLTKMIEALGLSRDIVWIGNINKCRPPENRTPTPEEMAMCSPFLAEQLNVIKPKVICALGKTAAVGLGALQPTDSLGKARGKLYQWNSIPVVLTYHPSYLLRSPGEKVKAWEDLQLLLPYVTRKANESSS